MKMDHSRFHAFERNGNRLPHNLALEIFVKEKSRKITVFVKPRKLENVSEQSGKQWNFLRKIKQSFCILWSTRDGSWSEHS